MPRRKKKPANTGSNNTSKDVPDDSETVQGDSVPSIDQDLDASASASASTSTSIGSGQPDLVADLRDVTAESSSDVPSTVAVVEENFEVVATVTESVEDPGSSGREACVDVKSADEEDAAASLVVETPSSEPASSCDAVQKEDNEEEIKQSGDVTQQEVDIGQKDSSSETFAVATLQEESTIVNDISHDVSSSASPSNLELADEKKPEVDSKTDSPPVQSTAAAADFTVDEVTVVAATAPAKKNIFIDQFVSRGDDEFSWIAVEVPPQPRGILHSVSSASDNSAVDECVMAEIVTEVQSGPPSGPLVDEDVLVVSSREATRIDINALFDGLTNEKPRRTDEVAPGRPAQAVTAASLPDVVFTDVVSEKPPSSVVVVVEGNDANVVTDQLGDVGQRSIQPPEVVADVDHKDLLDAATAGLGKVDVIIDAEQTAAEPDVADRQVATVAVGGLHLSSAGTVQEGEVVVGAGFDSDKPSQTASTSFTEDLPIESGVGVDENDTENVGEEVEEVVRVIEDADKSVESVVDVPHVSTTPSSSDSQADAFDKGKVPEVEQVVDVEPKTLVVDQRVEFTAALSVNEPQSPVDVWSPNDCKASPNESRKSKTGSSNGGSGGVFGLFQRKPKGGSPPNNEELSVDFEVDGEVSVVGSNVEKGRKSNSLEKTAVVGREDRILLPTTHGATLPADSKNNGFQMKIPFNGGKDKSAAVSSSDDGEAADSMTSVVAASKKPRPHSADVKVGCKSPSKTNIRIFEIMANKPVAGNATMHGVGGSGTPLGTQSTVAQSPLTYSKTSTVETSVLRSVGPPLVLPSGGNSGNSVDGPSMSFDATDNKPQSPSSAGETISAQPLTSASTVPRRHQPLQPSVSIPSAAERSQNGVSLPYIVTVAIDFGTAFSGYAFSFFHESSVSATDKASTGTPSVHMMGKWEGADPGVINQKTPSTLLLTPEGEFHSFGFTARNFYHDLTPEEADQWLYFDKFKMALYHSEECNTSTTIEAANGRRFSAFKAVSMTLGFFKQHALVELSNHCGTQIVNDDVRWVVTVPAIWNAQAKQFMRLAAYEAGLASSQSPGQLLIALEPEAASIHIRRLRMHQLVPEKPVRRPLSIRRDDSELQVDLERVSSKFNSRDVRYMVVDCGGGTVDITVHELDTATGRLQELHKAAGGPHGSCGIDEEFEKLLEAIFGADHIRAFRRKRPSGWICLMTAFEARKRAADPNKTNYLNIPLPFSFIDYYRKHSNTTVEAAIIKYDNKDIRWSSQGMLRLTQEAMRVLFESTLDNIRQIVTNILNHPTLNDIRYIFLVGGLSESTVLQQDLRTSFAARVQVFVPHEASLAVLKGAVGFGLDQSVVTVRRSRLTYGAAVLKRFIRGRHPESKLLRRAGVDWCRDVFDPYVVVDQTVRQGEVVVRPYTPASPSQTFISIKIYSSQHPQPIYSTDDGVTKCATLRLDLPPIATPPGGAQQQQPRVIEARMTFADTEINVSAVDVISGQSVNASFDFFDA